MNPFYDDGLFTCYDCGKDIEPEDDVWVDGEVYHPGCAPNEWETIEESMR